jgi:hypothetical protein
VLPLEIILITSSLCLFLDRDFDYGNQDMLESVKEEKRRKQMEAIAEDLFNTEKVTTKTCLDELE